MSLTNNHGLAFIQALETKIKDRTQSLSDFSAKEAADYLGIPTAQFQKITRLLKITRDVLVDGPKKGMGKSINRYSRAMIDDLKMKIEAHVEGGAA